MRQALDARDMGAVITIFRRWTGASQTDVGVLLGLSQPHVSDFERGIRRATSLAMFERFADGLGIPRPLLGLGEPSPHATEPETQGAQQQGPAQQAPTIRSVEFVEWIAKHSGASFREVYDRLAARIRQFQRIPEPERRHRTHLRTRVTREQLVTALAEYYPAPLAEGCAFYQVVLDGVSLPTTVLTRPEWLRAQVGLGTGAERFEYVPPSAVPIPVRDLGDDALAAAVDRLADAELSDTVLTNDPVYRLLRVAVEHERLDAAVTLMPFADYALTMDLLESELVDALAEQDTMGMAATGRRRPALPLRDAHLPSVLHALDMQRRVCAGGPVALLAAARPAGAAGRRQADYALLVQERSPRVLNAVGKLAVIPKAFHQPTVEPAAEADLSTSLQRELEEELLGREELGNLFGRDFRKIDPLHADLRSPPLRWLLEHRDSNSYRVECVGFGINLLSGNYEFACLILIDDEEWWRRFGSLIEANWEIERIRLYSSRDTGGLRDLMLDPRWSNEGLFAFSQGLRRLTELDSTDRVAAPRIEVGV
jgi:transcriptional regulator with XRE-family HTH domain